ncbi:MULTISPECIES: hypothetical protein [Pseudomonas]|nr:MULTISPECIES: hypothetical protein [Pseudomonas]
MEKQVRAAYQTRWRKVWWWNHDSGLQVTPAGAPDALQAAGAVDLPKEKQ